MLARQLPLFHSATIFLFLFVAFFGCLSRGVDALNCYGTDMQSKKCEPIDLWCIKFINGTQITRDCANVYDYCTDEDEGCYPELDADGLKQKWCCCKSDNCNISSQPKPAIFSMIFATIFIFYMM